MQYGTMKFLRSLSGLTNEVCSLPYRPTDLVLIESSADVISRNASYVLERMHRVAGKDSQIER